MDIPKINLFQTSMCLIAQISSLPSHRVALNIGFQTNYQLPYQLPSFYSPVFWARKFSHASNPLVNFFERMAENGDEIEETVEKDHSLEFMDTTEVPIATEFEELETTEDNFKNFTDGHDRHKRMASFDSDLSAGQFYYGIIDILE